MKKLLQGFIALLSVALVSVPVAFSSGIYSQSNYNPTSVAITGGTLSNVAIIGGSISGINVGFITEGQTPTPTTSGTVKTITGIPSAVKQITIVFNAISTNGTSNLLVQLGTASGVDGSGYTTGAFRYDAAYAAGTAGFIQTYNMNAAGTMSGSLILTRADSTTNTWVAQGVNFRSDNYVTMTSGTKALSGPLDRFAITTVSGDTFDAGNFNYLYIY